MEIDYYLRLTRTLEERLVALVRQAKVIGGVYRSLGQEGESVAAASALDCKQGDVVQPLIRNMGSILVAGAKPADIIRQYMAKGDSPTRGRELNIHFGHPERDGFIGQRPSTETTSSLSLARRSAQSSARAGAAA